MKLGYYALVGSINNITGGTLRRNLTETLWMRLASDHPCAMKSVVKL